MFLIVKQQKPSGASHWLIRGHPPVAKLSDLAFLYLFLLGEGFIFFVKLVAFFKKNLQVGCAILKYILSNLLSFFIKKIKLLVLFHIFVLFHILVAHFHICFSNWLCVIIFFSDCFSYISLPKIHTILWP